ncbi:MAG: hypothetical protein K6348_02565 [Deferribacterales bacterium]
MSTKYINLIPSKYRFDLKKYLYIRGMIIFLAFNLFALISFYVIDRFNIYFYNKKIDEKKMDLKRVNDINLSLKGFEDEKQRYNKVFSEITLSENLYYKIYNVQNSAFIDLITFLNLTTEGITIKNIDYREGIITANCIAKNAQSFYKYYKKMEEDNNIVERGFSNLTKQETGLYHFDVKVKMRGLGG